MNDIKIPELLAPAGSPEALYAAVSAGADAVYLSGKKFGARRFAKNFDDNGLESAIYYCHTRGVRVYITLNTLISDSEMPDALKEMLFYYTIGADAVLVQDLGLLKLSSECIPGICLHASTQMTINSTPGVVRACRMNLKRVVLARELSASGIKRIRDSSEECKAELEIFIHGALCYCYSGQCLFSSLIGGRSGNRGMCAQPCRKKYTLLSGKKDEFGKISLPVPVASTGPYLFSPRDLCSYENLWEISELGVESLKIEGRMKSAAYVALVVSVYRKALDSIKKGNWSPSADEKMKLVFAFNRLFTGGYLKEESGQALMSQDRPDNRGIFLGNTESYNSSTKDVSLKIKGHLVPETGDGLSVRIKGREKDDGFILRPPFSVKNNILSFKSPYHLRKGDPVYITRRESVAAFASEAAGRDGGICTKIPVDVSVSFSGNIPVVKGSFSLFERRFDIIFKAPFEMAKADKKPVMISDLKRVFGKTGGTQYSLSSFEADYAEDLFAPVRLLNDLRRDFISALEKETAEQLIPSAKAIDDAKRNISSFLSGFKAEDVSDRKAGRFTFYADTTGSVKGAVRGGCRRIYFEPDVDINDKESDLILLKQIKTASAICKDFGAVLIWKWPRITDDVYLDFAVPLLEKTVHLGISGIMTESAGAAYAVRKIVPDLMICGSAGLNIFNSSAAVCISDLFSCVTLSQELSGTQIRDLIKRIPSDTDIKTECIIQGAAELMVSENNLIATSLIKKHCVNSSSEDLIYAVCDEKGHIFPLYADSRGRTHLYNSAETCLIDSLPNLLKEGPDYLAIDGRRRGGEYAYSVVKSYMDAAGLILSKSPQIKEDTDRLKKRLQKISYGGITEGHYRRGV